MAFENTLQKIYYSVRFWFGLLFVVMTMLFRGLVLVFFFDFKKMTQGVVIDIWPDFNRQRE